jgi:hypothetical protein
MLNRRRIILRVLLALVLIVVAVSLGSYVYNLGVAQGVAQSVRLSDLPPGAAVAPYPYYYGGPFGFYRPFGFFGPLLFFFLFFLLFRGLWWGGRWERGVPPAFEEWHRRVHREEQTSNG